MNHLSPKILFAALVLGAGAFGCSSSTANTGAAAQSETFTDLYTTVLQTNCATHHAAGAEDSFLDLSTQAVAYKSLVGVKADGPACGSSGLTRVIVGSPSTSLLYEKVAESSPPCGQQMPYGGPYLSAADQEKVYNWIADGAPNN